MRAILAGTARKNNPTESGWTTNTAGYHINDNYGFGVVDAEAAVAAAKTWTNLPAETTFNGPSQAPGLAIPDNNATGVSDSVQITGSNISHIEWISVTFSADDHPYDGDLKIVLTNVNTGTQSVLADTHLCQSSASPATCSTRYSGWVFGDARHLGEAADAVWKLTVIDGAAQDTGHFQSWQLKFYGH